MIFRQPDVALIDLRERHGAIPASLHVPYPSLHEHRTIGTRKFARVH